MQFDTTPTQSTCMRNLKMTITCDFHVSHKAICFPHQILYKHCFQFSLGSNNRPLRIWNQNLSKIFLAKQIASWRTGKSQMAAPLQFEHPYYWGGEGWVGAGEEFVILPLSFVCHLSLCWVSYANDYNTKNNNDFYLSKKLKFSNYTGCIDPV